MQGYFKMDIKNILSFLQSLSLNNNREWFNAHKGDYLEIKATIDQLAQQLINKVTEFDKSAVYLTPTDCTYRIYRDTRFSTDKTPYKTHIGIFINPPFGKKSNRMGYYLHIEPEASFVAVGTVCLPSKTVGAIRKSIYDNVEEYISIIDEKNFKSAYPIVGENRVKTAPKGFSINWPYIDLVRPRDYCASHPLSTEEVCATDLVDRVGELFKVAKPFNDFINYTIDEVKE